MFTTFEVPYLLTRLEPRYRVRPTPEQSLRRGADLRATETIHVAPRRANCTVFFPVHVYGENRTRASRIGLLRF